MEEFWLKFSPDQCLEYCYPNNIEYSELWNWYIFFIFEHTSKILLTIFTVSGQNSFTYFVKFITAYWIFWPKSVLVCQWFHKKIPQTHDLNDRNYFHTILEVKSPRWRCGQGCFFWVISLLFSYGWALAVSSNDHQSVHKCPWCHSVCPILFL